MIRVLVNGAFGCMGQESVTAIEADPELSLIGKVGRQDDLADAIGSYKPDVVLDFTLATTGRANAEIIIKNNVRPVIGTSGFLPEHVAELTTLAAQYKLGGIIVPNFSIGAVLMMQLAKIAKKHFKDVEIIEMHHAGKQDMPSGTAINTASLLAGENKDISSIPIHSVRLPGFVAQQQVIFGGNHETLTIKHDSIHRKSFMPGVCLACKKVMELDKLVYGLENIISL